MSTFAAGSLTQLVAKGALDMYLTSNPQSTFWKSGFSRCTAFSMEAIVQPFSGSGGDRHLDLTRTGDLLYTQYLMVTLPGIRYTGYDNMTTDDMTEVAESKTLADVKTQLPPQAAAPCGDCGDEMTTSQAATNLVITQNDESCLQDAAYVHYTNSVGQYIINTLDILIGSQHVDTLYGDFLFVHEELCGKVGRRLLEMVGKRYTREELIVDSQEQRTLYIPLPFWYTLSSGSALPLAGLQFHSVRYNMIANPMDSCVVVHHKKHTDDTVWVPKSTPFYDVCQGGKGQAGSASKEPVFSLLSTYVYLDDQERTMMSKINQETLIIQHQRAVFAAPTGSSQWDLNLPFNHPVIELVWFVRDKNAAGATNDHFNLGTRSGRDPISNATLRLNNQLRFGTESGSSTNGTYFRLVQPYQSHSCIPDTFVYCYSFALHPEDTTTPSGSANFSRIDSAQLTLTPSKFHDSNSACEVVVFATNWNIARMKSGLFGVAYSS